MAEGDAVTVRRQGDIAVVTVDNPPVNAMSHAARAALLAAVQAAAADPAVTAIVLTGTGSVFIGGADIKEMDRPTGPPLLTDIILAMETTGKPVIAAINGAALGGGLEVALGCDLRFAAPGASIGLPETRLGIVPGAGGTQRLPRLVGAAKARALICEARILKAAEALELGIVDRVETDPLAAALAAATTAVKRRVSELSIPSTQDEAPARGGGRAQIAAIGEAARLVELAGKVPFAEGLAEERRTFVALRGGDEAHALRHVFFAERAAERVPGVDRKVARTVGHVGVVGAGTMGAAIAATFADAGLSVAIVERDDASVEAGRGRVADIYRRLHEGGRLSADEAERRRDRIALGTDWNAFSDADLIVEAAFESMDVKRDIFARMDAIAKPGAVLASNTSYLDLDAIAAATRRPGDVVGLHFFAPANVMKLLEIVRGRETGADVLATGLALARKLGKQAVVAGNTHGFIGNRIFSVYRRHAEYMMEDGASPYEIDAALTAFGLPMGVFAVSDLSGLDISYAMRRSLDATRDPAERYVKVADRLVEAGRLGRKSGAGYYDYSTGRPQPDPATMAVVAAARAEKGIVARTFSIEAIQRRLLAAMINEGAALLESGTATRASDIDLVMINGYGFPRHKGGPMFAADRIGLPAVVAEIEAAAAASPGSIAVSPLLRSLAAGGRTLASTGPD